jgi:carbon monoxide dehydrogenase subunit G
VLIASNATIEAPLDKVWELLQDIPRVSGCMPGAEITETVDDHTWKAKVGVKVGPLSVGYNATITRQSLDPVAHSATMRVEAVDSKGRGTISATIVTSAVANGNSKISPAACSRSSPATSPRRSTLRPNGRRSRWPDKGRMVSASNDLEHNCFGVYFRSRDDMFSARRISL